MRKKIFLAALLALVTLTGWAQNTKIIAQEKGSITFVVDEKLGKVEKEKSYFVKGDIIASLLIYDWHRPKEKKKIIACSFGDEQLLNLGEDAFSKMLYGVKDEIDFCEFGFGATHKEKRIKLLK